MMLEVLCTMDHKSFLFLLLCQLYHFRYALNTSIPVLTAKDIRLQSSMGNLDGPSFIDVALINTHYKCARLTLFLITFRLC